MAGFKPYDVIRALEGEDVDDQNELLGYLFDYRPGDTISLEIVREGKEVPVTMTLGSQ